MQDIRMVVVLDRLGGLMVELGVRELEYPLYDGGIMRVSIVGAPVKTIKEGEVGDGL